ncbi:MAG: CpaF family protein [Bdellovibrionales bacterium]|nr:CpaF family protein [Oligoflexia bacterium]
MECIMSSELPANLRALIESTEITDICFNRHDQVFYDSGQGVVPYEGIPIFAGETEYRNFVLEQISKSGKTWDAKLPFVDTVFFNTHRAHVAFPPLAQFGIYLSLRKLPRKQNTERSIAQTQALERWRESGEAFDILRFATLAHETILFAGGTGSGKTTLLNDLLSFVPEHERIVALEDTAEISPAHVHYLSLLSRTQNADGFGAVSLRDLLKQTLRMRPDRILLGECRGDEVLDLLQALNTGHRGTLATLHANSAKDALRRIELLALIAAKGTIPSSLIKELLAHGVQKLVFIARQQGVRKIETILQIEGIERDIIFTRPVFPTSKVPALHKETPSSYRL